MNLIHSAYAQVVNPLLPISKDSATDPFGAANTIIQTVISLFFLVGIIYFMWFMFMAGFHWIDSQGDPKKFENAKNEFVYGVIGLGVIFSVFAVLKFIGIVFNIPGLDTLQITWPTLPSGVGTT